MKNTKTTVSIENVNIRVSNQCLTLFGGLISFRNKIQYCIKMHFLTIFLCLKNKNF